MSCNERQPGDDLIPYALALLLWALCVPGMVLWRVLSGRCARCKHRRKEHALRQAPGFYGNSGCKWYAGLW